MNNKPIKIVQIGNGLDWQAELHQFDNGEGVMYYQLAINICSDTGSQASMCLPIEGSFDPDDLGKQLIRLEK